MVSDSLDFTGNHYLCDLSEPCLSSSRGGGHCSQEWLPEPGVQDSNVFPGSYLVLFHMQSGSAKLMAPPPNQVSNWLPSLHFPAGPHDGTQTGFPFLLPSLAPPQLHLRYPAPLHQSLLLPSFLSFSMILLIPKTCQPLSDLKAFAHAVLYT